MKQTCPYCEKKTSALKNHVRQSGAGGHAPSGQYPDGFGDGSESDSSRGAQAGAVDTQKDASGPQASTTVDQREADTPPHDDGDTFDSTADTVEMTPEQVDEMVNAAVEAARPDPAPSDTVSDGAEQEPTADASAGETAGDAPTCPDCEESRLVRPDAARRYIARCYQKRSALAVLARRRLKKLDRRIRQTGPAYVCPSCWTAYG
jgi:hypothetical protein